MKFINHNLADLYFAMFSGVGAGNRSGVNLVAFAIFPFIFILPVINALFGFNFLLQISAKSASLIVNVASAFLAS